MSSEPPGPGTQSRELVVPATPASIDAIHALIASLWATPVSLAPADRTRFELAVIEIANNIIKHATHLPTDSHPVTIELTLTADSDRITAQFRDDGTENKILPTHRQMPDETAEHGRGIPLTQALVDDLTYERTESINIWTLSCTRRDIRY